MAKARDQKAFVDQLSKVLAYRQKDLARRGVWGEINFEQIETTVASLYELTSELAALPTENLPDSAFKDISNQFPAVIESLKKIDDFRISVQNAPAVRDQIANEVTASIERLRAVSSLWIPYLAYTRGDVGKQIETLEGAISNAQASLRECETWAQTKKQEIEKTAAAAREAAASAGAAVFSTNFTTTAGNQRKLANTWLFATAAMALLTMAAAIVSFWWPAWPEGTITTLASILPRLTTKLVVLGMLFTATLWCGNVCRALLHQAAVNEHRGLSVSTLQAFVAASDDARTRDAVLLEATRTVFGRAPTGYVTENGEQGTESIRFIEIGKAVSDAAAK